LSRFLHFNTAFNTAFNTLLNPDSAPVLTLNFQYLDKFPAPSQLCTATLHQYAFIKLLHVDSLPPTYIACTATRVMFRKIVPGRQKPRHASLIPASETLYPDSGILLAGLHALGNTNALYYRAVMLKRQLLTGQLLS
jgi:hypothetical protein